MTNSKQADLNWQEFYNEERENYPQWPNESMVKVLFGNYLKNSVKFRGGKVIDVGCGYGNNLLPFAREKCACYGVEVTGEIAKKTQSILNSFGIDAAIKEGINSSIPFKADFFDLCISLNALHYEKNEEQIMNALKEYCRVLKPDGALYLSTVGPGHDIYKKAKVMGSHQFQIQDYDFRDGEQYFYFSDLKYLEYYLKQFFADIELGQVTEKLMTFDLDFLIAVCRNKLN
jgi:SAM-dependent methyltransferase